LRRIFIKIRPALFLFDFNRSTILASKTQGGFFYAHGYTTHDEQRDARVHQQLYDLPRYLSGDHSSLLADGRRTRLRETYRFIAGLRPNLCDERGFYAQDERLSPANVRRLRRDLRSLRDRMREDGERQRLYAALRRRLSPVRRILPTDVANGNVNGRF
jgi:hypothetical protein